MFCIRCHYDLRGQTSERCPECCTGFKSTDPETFYAIFPTRRKRFRRWATRNRRAIWFLTCVIIAISWWWTADQLPVQARYIWPSTVSSTNLKGLLTTWIIKQYEVGKPIPFDKELLKQDIRLSYSASTQYKVGRIRAGIDYWYRTGFAFLHLGSLLILCGLVIWLNKGLTRRIIAAASCLILIVLIDSMVGGPILSAVLPGSLDYVDDYVFLSDADLMSSNPPRGWDIVVAYERVPTSHRRVVGFSYGGARSLPDSELVPMLAAQGKTLAPDAVPTSQP